MDDLRQTGLLKNLGAMDAYCWQHGGSITEDRRSYGYIAETENYRFCLRCTPFPGEYQGYLYCYDLCQQEMYRQEHPVVGRVTFASGEQQEFTDSKALLQAIREELPFRSTTGFRFETLTDDPEVKKAVDDILLDFAGEDNSRRTCNYGLTETGKQALRKAADPSIPHTYAWFVMADTNTPQEIIRQDLTLEEAIQIYQDSNTSEKRLGVIKDGIATVDFVHFQSGEQQFFTDHEKLESFRSDLVVAEAMERLYQQLNQPDTRQKVLSTSERITTLTAELNDGNSKIEEMKAEFNRIVSWSKIFDESPMEVKKMICGYIIKKVSVFRDYRVKIEFNINVEQFLNGIDSIDECATYELPMAQ